MARAPINFNQPSAPVASSLLLVPPLCPEEVFCRSPLLVVVTELPFALGPFAVRVLPPLPLVMLEVSDATDDYDEYRFLRKNEQRTVRWKRGGGGTGKECEKNEGE